MKRKIIVGILWPISILLALWIGCVIGTNLGISVGKSETTTQYTWIFSSELLDIAESCKDTKKQKTIRDIVSLIQVVGQPDKYPSKIEEFKKQINEQNQ